MRVISNTSPILNLAIIGQLELLREQFGEITISNAVRAELQSDQDRPGSHAIQAALQAGWIKVAPAQNYALVQVLQHSLDEGEAEAIALALELRADFVLLDERDGRKSAQSLGLSVVGVLGILLKARRAGRVASLRQAIQDLQTQAAFRIHPRLMAEIQALPEYQDTQSKKRLAEVKARYAVKPHARRKINLSGDNPAPVRLRRGQGRRSL